MKLLLTAVATASFVASAAGQPATDAGFCERLAPKMGMKRKGDASDSGWSVNIAKGIGPALFGGTFTASFAVEPIDTDVASENARLKDACQVTSRGMLCKIDGPARLKVGTKAGTVEAEVQADEQAEVEMRKSIISCRHGAIAERADPA